MVIGRLMGGLGPQGPELIFNGCHTASTFLCTHPPALKSKKRWLSPFFFSATEARMLQVLSTCWWVGVCLFTRAHLPLWRVVRTAWEEAFSLFKRLYRPPFHPLQDGCPWFIIYWLDFHSTGKSDTKMITTSPPTKKWQGFSLKRH